MVGCSVNNESEITWSETFCFDSLRVAGLRTEIELWTSLENTTVVVVVVVVNVVVVVVVIVVVVVVVEEEELLKHEA
jgi:hypothetical protein